MQTRIISVPKGMVADLDFIYDDPLFGIGSTILSENNIRTDVYGNTIGDYFVRYWIYLIEQRYQIKYFTPIEDVSPAEAYAKLGPILDDFLQEVTSDLDGIGPYFEIKFIDLLSMEITTHANLFAQPERANSRSWTYVYSQWHSRIY